MATTFTRQPRTFNSTKTTAIAPPTPKAPVTPATPAPTASVNLDKLKSQLLTAQDFLKSYKSDTGSTAIGFNTLNENPKPLNVPPVTTKTNTSALGGAVDSTLGDATAVLSQQDVIDQNKATAQTYLEKILGNIGGQASAVDAINKSAGLAQKKERAQKLSTEIDVLDKKYRDTVNAIQKNPEGKFGGALQADINQATDEYNNNRANVALVYKVAVEDYQGAQDIANQKVQALKDQNSQELQAYQLLVQSINNDLTESEKIQAQANIQEKQAQQKVISDAYSTTLQAAVQNGAPSSILSAIDTAAKTPGATAASIYSAAGQYGADLLGNQIKRAQLAKLQEGNKVSTQIVDVGGRKLLVNSDTGETIKEIGGGGGTDTLRIAQAQGNIQQVADLTTNSYLSSAVGPNALARLSPTSIITGGKANFIASVEQIRSQLNLDKLIESKAQGATFGALSDNELQVLASAGTKLGTWAIKNDSGQVTGYKASEKDFKKELDKVNNYAKLDALLKGADPASIGVTVMADGTFWTKNSDGTATQLQ